MSKKISNIYIDDGGDGSLSSMALIQTTLNEFGPSSGDNND